MRTRCGSVSGFTLVEIMIVVAIIGLILTIAVPSWVKTRTRAQTDACIEQLAQIETAKQLWGLEKAKSSGDVPNDGDLFGPGLYLKRKPECPGGGTYDLKGIGISATCTVDGHKL
jgi:prepilin-type N-terminal cleavage/methylation domain-containing protein